MPTYNPHLEELFDQAFTEEMKKNLEIRVTKFSHSSEWRCIIGTRDKAAVHTDQRDENIYVACWNACLQARAQFLELGYSPRDPGPYEEFLERQPHEHDFRQLQVRKGTRYGGLCSCGAIRWSDGMLEEAK